MNILYLHTHDTGRYIQPYGCGITTPNLQQLAEEGALFRQAYCAGPTCSPSRAALLTGKMPHTNGMWGLTHRGFSLFNPQEHLSNFLAGHGYDTALCGIQHEAEDIAALGYRRILGSTDYSMGNCSRDWRNFDLENAFAAADYLFKPKDKPFFLSVGLFNTHRKFPPLSDRTKPQYVQVPAGICDTEENRRDMAAFIESAQIADKAAGIVLDAVKASGHEDDTIVLFTTDHGIAFPQSKCTLYDSGIGVAMLIKRKGSPIAGTAVDALVSHLDIFPTLCDLAGLPPPDGLHGVSLAPILSGGSKKVRERIFAETNFHVAYSPERCVRTQRFKYIRRYAAYEKPMASNIDDCPDKDLRRASGYFDLKQPRELLFDLINDPLERVNLWEEPAYQDTKKSLSESMDDWMVQTDDPLRQGVMKPPKGALVNYPDSFSPSEKIFIQDFSEL